VTKKDNVSTFSID